MRRWRYFLFGLRRWELRLVLNGVRGSRRGVRAHRAHRRSYVRCVGVPVVLVLCSCMAVPAERGHGIPNVKSQRSVSVFYKIDPDNGRVVFRYC